MKNEEEIMEKCKWCEKYIRSEQRRQHDNGDVYHEDCHLDMLRLREQGCCCETCDDCVCVRGID